MKGIFKSCNVVAVLPSLLICLLFLFNSTPAYSDDIWYQNTDLAGKGNSSRTVTALATPTITPETRSIVLPLPDGTNLAVQITPTSLLSAALHARYPHMQTFRVSGENGISGTMEINTQGLYARLLTPSGVVQIVPEQHFSNTASDLAYRSTTAMANEKPVYNCGVEGHDHQDHSLQYLLDDNSRDAPKDTSEKRFGDRLKIYRIAISTSLGYRNAVSLGSPTAAKAFNQVVIALNRINQVFERDVSVRFELVSGEELMADSQSTFPGSNSSSLLNANQSYIDSRIGSDAYDIGHILTSNGGGLASVASVCDNTRKAKGASGLSNPTTEIFYIDLLAHEIGHQLGATHSFNGQSGFCAGNRQQHSNGSFADDDSRSEFLAASAVEVGSGSTIMSYAGICQGEDLQGAVNPYFHGRSVEQIREFIDGEIPFSNVRGDRCGRSETRSTLIPNVDAGPDYIIPKLSPFRLSASSNTAGTYTWEQMDLGNPSVSANMMHTDQGSGPLIRSMPGSSDGIRLIPFAEALKQNDMIANKGERLPSRSRSLNFRVTLRAQDMGVDQDDMRLSVDGDSGPFIVTAPNGSDTFDGLSIQQVRWDVAGTDQAPVNCANVEIAFSADGGDRFAEVLTPNTPNDGDEDVVIPNLPTSGGRIRVRCVDNVFFNYSVGDFSVAAAPGTATIAVSPLALQQFESNKTFTYTLIRTGDITTALTIRYRVEAVAAPSANPQDFQDNQLPQGQVTFEAGSDRAELTINVSDDSDIEDHEGFSVVLSSDDPDISMIDRVSATILDDDASPIDNTSNDSPSGGGNMGLLMLLILLTLGVGQNRLISNRQVHRNIG
ncbi:Uncharacterised protein [BD1-7 clade bacterium]|uniref:Calx-beta domain-containing protein n=1 Tax=BD1-7 clade bacterium TaxID=2029982 RepID=A0A5S9P3Q0_9GAMM|nr:Uncharacterised protein [BD1-7 clade bacterium]CAA0098096.1 Uncharacterised protein [BD1-7 clade bacterium]